MSTDWWGKKVERGLAHETQEWQEQRHFCQPGGPSAGLQPALDARINKTPGRGASLQSMTKCAGLAFFQIIGYP
jgi:hypothetical protein